MTLRRREVLGAGAAALLAIGGARGAELSFQKDANHEWKPDRKAVDWFRRARFGMFVHWGVYSLLGRGEWVMQNEGIPIVEYEKLPPQFNPTKFNAPEWVKMVKDSGMRYITITSKHHDGFCMFHTKLTDYNIVDRTPFKRDPMAELAEECHKHGIKLFFYYSQLDWHHPDFYPRGGTGLKAGRRESGDWNRYKEYYIGQVRELCTNYGPIGGIWFDGWWDRPKADWGHDTLYPMIHRLQPQALVGNNHHQKPFAGEDFQMFEQDLPGENTAGFNTTHESALPYETCRTMNNSWGLTTADHAHKSPTELIRYLVQAAGRDANLLLNTGPLPTGEVLPEHRERYLEMGKWLKSNGKTVYGTRGGPIRPGAFGVTTYRDKEVFVHVLNPAADRKITLPPFPTPILRGHRLTGEAVPVVQTDSAVTIDLPEALSSPTDSIVVLNLATGIK